MTFRKQTNSHCCKGRSHSRWGLLPSRLSVAPAWHCPLLATGGTNPRRPEEDLRTCSPRRQVLYGGNTGRKLKPQHGRAWSRITPRGPASWDECGHRGMDRVEAPPVGKRHHRAQVYRNRHLRVRVATLGHLYITPTSLSLWFIRLQIGHPFI